MPATQVETESKPWDFSPVLDFLETLRTSYAAEDAFPSAVQPPIATGSLVSIPSKANRLQLVPKSHVDAVHHLSGPPDASTALGDFHKVFQFLGTANLEFSTSSASGLEELPSKTDYASDGAAYHRSRRDSGIQRGWQDGTDIDESNTASDRPVSSPVSVLSKKARWRQNKRANKGSKQSPKPSSQQHPRLSDSEAYSIVKKTPARKASVHVLHSEPPPSGHSRSHVASASVAEVPRSKSSVKKPTAPNGFDLPKRDDSKLRPAHHAGDTLDERLSNHNIVNHHIDQVDTQTHMLSANALPSPSRERPSPSDPAKAHFRLIPASVQPSCLKTTSNSVKATPLPSTPDPAPANVYQTPTKVTPARNLERSLTSSSVPRSSRRKFDIEPVILRSGEDRNWALLMKLIDNFYEDRKHLVSPMNLTTHNNNPDGIHVFIDASNIFIGFMDQLRRSRNIPMYAHITPIDPSFDSLALLLERRRPVAKRVLVGSAPEAPAFTKARAVGYKCSILDKVYKARELTERQIFFRNKDLGLVPPNAKAPPHGARSGALDYGSGSETSTPQYAPAALVEQGVDEILHMNILQSLVDNATPATMVLATGDGAQAEYSDGFMAMVERALKKGWTVELVSWSKNISQLYTRKTFTEQWGSKFRIIFLDDYAEELLDL